MIAADVGGRFSLETLALSIDMREDRLPME